MLNLKNVRKKPWLVDKLPAVGQGTSHAVYPRVYLARRVYQNVVGDNPDPYTVSVVIHEQEHIRRMRKYGVLAWYARYVTSRSFRLYEELAAIKPQLAYIKREGLGFNLEQKAKILSSWLYFWPASYQKTLETLRTMWNEL